MVAGLLLLTIAPYTTSAQTTPSGAPVIPVPSGDVRKGAPKEGSAPKIQIGKAETVQLTNGLTVIVVENHKLPRVSFRVFADYDPVREGDASGYIEMMGELLSKGTTTRSKADLDIAVDFIGASLSSDANGVSGACLTKHTDKLLDLMADVLLNPSFPEEELQKAKRRAESGLAASKDNADAIAGNVRAVLNYGKDHPYGEIMTEQTLANITMDKIRSHYNTYFKPNISYLVVVGDISRADALAKAQKYFGKWQSGEVPQNAYTAPKAPAKSQIDFVHKVGAVQSVINVTYPLNFPQNSPDVIPARLMNSILGGGTINSRLNLNLREGKAYTYGSYSSLSPDKFVGSFNASASVRNAVTDSAVIEFRKELNRIRTEKVPADELQLMKNVMTGQFSQSLERPGTIANFALNIQRYKLPADYYETYLSRLQSVTAEEIMAVAQKYILPENAHFLIVGNKDDVADRLKQFAEDGKINFYDIYGNPLEDKKTAIPAGVTPETVIADFVNAIGGAKKIAALKDVKTSVNLVTPGPTLDMDVIQKDGNKVAVIMEMQGNVVSNRVYNDGKGSEVGMGGARALEGEELEDMKEQASFCKEANYQSAGYKLKLKGVEPLDGKNAYVLEIERPDGKVTTEYYDMSSSLKVREINTSVGMDGQPTTIITDFGDYKEVGGVKFAHSITIVGAFPVPLKGTVTDLKVNAGVDDKLFQVK